MPKQVRDENGLTVQQGHFVKLLAKGYSQVDAYVEAWKPRASVKRNSLYERASQQAR